MTCRKWTIGHFIRLLEDQLSSAMSWQLNAHIDYCFDCQVRFMAVSDSLSINKCSVDWLGLEYCLNQFVDSLYSSISKFCIAPVSASVITTSYPPLASLIVYLLLILTKSAILVLSALYPWKFQLYPCLTKPTRSAYVLYR